MSEICSSELVLFAVITMHSGWLECFDLSFLQFEHILNVLVSTYSMRSLTIVLSIQTVPSF